MCLCVHVCVCAALLWQSVHINMSVLFTCRLLLWPTTTTTASPSPSPSSSFFLLSGCDLCAYICYNNAVPISITHTLTTIHLALPLCPYPSTVVNPIERQHFTCREQFLLHTFMGAHFLPPLRECVSERKREGAGQWGAREHARLVCFFFVVV